MSLSLQPTTTGGKGRKRKSNSQATPSSTPQPPPKRRKTKNNVSGLGARSKLSTGPLNLASGNQSTTRVSQWIAEDEYIAEVNGSVAFASTTYPLNIGSSSTFPWASRIAQNYDRYAFSFIEFYYRREVSEFATNGQSGKVMLSFDYDASDAAPITKQQVLDTVPHVDGMPCKEEIVLRLSPSDMAFGPKGLYIRPGAQPANTDIKTYDVGNLYVSTFGNTNTSVIGELRVRYRCHLTVPILEAAGSASSGAGSYFEIASNLSGETAAATTVYNSLFATATGPVTRGNGIGASINSAGLITLVAGTYLIDATVTASNATVDVTQLTTLLTASATANTSPVFASFGSANVADTNTTSGNQVMTRASTKLLWNTSVMGVLLDYQAAATYASGVTLNQAYLRITQV